MAEELKFTYDASGINRSDLLEKAARTVDEFKWIDLSPGGGSEAVTTPEAQLLRELDGDVARFSGFPVVRRISEDDFAEHGLKVPVRFEQLGKLYRFYWIGFPIVLIPKRNWPFHRLECLVEFNPGQGVGHLLPKAYQILPDKKFQELFRMNDGLEIRLGENFEFEASVESKVKAAVKAKAAADLGIIVGPFSYSIKRALIDHTAVGLEKVFWRVEGTSFFQDDDLTFVVIAQVPSDTTEVKIAAAMQVYRDFSLAAANVTAAIENLGTWLKSFFQAGMPIRDTKTWDISPRL